MASSLRLAKLRTAGFNVSNMLGFNGNHIAAMSSPLDKAVGGNIFLPEFDRKPVEDPNTNVEIGLPSHLYGGSMELMAVPKKKVFALCNSIFRNAYSAVLVLGLGYLFCPWLTGL